MAAADRAKPVQGRWRADGSNCQPFGVERAAGPALTLAVGFATAASVHVLASPWLIAAMALTAAATSGFSLGDSPTAGPLPAVIALRSQIGRDV